MQISVTCASVTGSYRCQPGNVPVRNHPTRLWPVAPMQTNYMTNYSWHAHLLHISYNSYDLPIQDHFLILTPWLLKWINSIIARLAMMVHVSNFFIVWLMYELQPGVFLFLFFMTQYVNHVSCLCKIYRFFLFLFSAMASPLALPSSTNYKLCVILCGKTANFFSEFCPPTQWPRCSKLG